VARAKQERAALRSRGEEKGGEGKWEKKKGRRKRGKKKGNRREREKEKGERGGREREGRVGADRGGDRGRSATRERRPRAAREAQHCTGADRGKRSRVGGTGGDIGQVRCRTGRVRVRVLATNDF
jgi:hypothetical protein